MKWIEGASTLTETGAATTYHLTDKERLDFLESGRFSVYRDYDPETGRLGHWVVVNETAYQRRGAIGDTLRDAIDDAAAQLEIKR